MKADWLVYPLATWSKPLDLSSNFDLLRFVRDYTFLYIKVVDAVD